MTENLRNAVARVASKTRRDKESVEFQQLTELLPFSLQECEKLDKESIVRLVIAYLRLHCYLHGDAPVCSRSEVRDTADSTCRVIRVSGQPVRSATDFSFDSSATPVLGQVTEHGTPAQTTPPSLEAAALPQTESACTDTSPASGSAGQLSLAEVPAPSPVAWRTFQDGELLLQLLNRFLVLLNRKGRVLYVSRNVEEFLGIQQVWLLGRWLADCIHPDDVNLLQQQLELTSSPSTGPQPAKGTSSGYVTARDFHLRMRHFPNGAGARKKPGNFLVVRWTGQVRTKVSVPWRGGRARANGLVCLCHPVQSNSILEVGLGGTMFISRHDMRMTFTYCDPRVLYLIGYDPESLTGHTVYTFHNPQDIFKCASCHEQLIKTGAGVSQHYRFLSRTGVWVWMQTKATIVTDTRQRPQYVVCNNYVISPQEGERRHQMELQKLQLPCDDLTAPAVIDLSHVTSPASSLGDDREDTGYNTAVSSIASNSASPSPQGGAGGGSLDADPLMSDGALTLDPQGVTDSLTCHLPQPDADDFTRQCLDISRGAEAGVSSADAEEQLMGSDVPLSVTCPAPPFAADVTVDCDSADPFLYSQGDGGCGEGLPSVMEDMELLEDLLEKIGDCDKTDSGPFVTSLGPQIPAVTSPSAREARAGKPTSLLRTLLDKEGQALADRPHPALAPTTSSPPPPRAGGGARCRWEVEGGRGALRHWQSSGRSLMENARRGSVSASDNDDDDEDEDSEDESTSLAALPDDLLDFAMQYCEDIPDMDSPLADMDSPMPDALPCLESDAWGASMHGLMSDGQDSLTSSCGGDSPARAAADVRRATGSDSQPEELHKSRQDFAGKVNDKSPGVCKPPAVIQSAVVSSTQHAADKPTAGRSLAGDEGCAALAAAVSEGAPSGAAIVVGVAGTAPAYGVLSDHQYSTARVPAPRGGLTGAGGVGAKRGSAEGQRGAVGQTVAVQAGRAQPALKIVRKSPQCVDVRRGDSQPLSKALHATAHVPANTASGQAATLSVQGSSKAAGLVPVNGGGKPLTAMSELEKHLRGLVAPPLERSKDGEVTDDEVCEEGQARPFLERLLTGEMSHERYRQIDYQLLYQEREKRRSESSVAGDCS